MTKENRSFRIDLYSRYRFLLFLLLTAPQLQANGPLPLPRLDGSIVLDGVIDEPAWTKIEPLPLVMYQPTYKGEMTERTEIRVAYDDEAIYMSGRLFHNNTNDIRGNSYYRDLWSGDDTFAIVLDTFNDNENALWFYTNPLGTRTDIAVSNDASGGRRDSNSDWNTHWDVATKRNENGWTAEFRIPFSSLPFQDDNGRVVMGLIAYRWISVGGQRYIYPDIPPNWERASNKPSVAQDVVLEGVYRQKPVYFTPYFLGGTEQVAELNPTQTGYQSTRQSPAEIGLDAKYNLARNLTLDATVNTDFAQVEADDQQINLTRFPLFFPEKRQFFQERAGIFEFGFENSNRLFHSRRIGLDASGNPTRIYGGARLVGRIDDWDVGFLNMHANKSAGAQSENVPTENFGVLRLRRQILNENSTVGGMLTSKIDTDGDYNLAYGLDGVVRVVGQDYLTFKMARTQKNDQPDDLLRNSRLFFSWARRSIKGFSYDLTYSRAGADFDPGLGFQARNDFTYVWNSIDYQSFKDESSILRRVWIGHWGRFYRRNEDGSIQSVWLHPFYWFGFKNGASALISTDHFYEDVRMPFSLSSRDDAQILPGSYWFHNVWLSVSSPDAWYFRPTVTLRAGSFYDGWKTSLQVTPRWNLSRHLELSGDYILNAIRFSDRDQEFDSHLARLRVRTALNTRISLNSFLQYNSATDRLSLNARFRYHFGEGNDLWLVYDEGLNTERDVFVGPSLPFSNSRALVLKYTHTLIR